MSDPSPSPRLPRLKFAPSARPLAPRQRFGKYRILRRIGEGGFAVVYAAIDTIEGVQVAVKEPHPHLMRPDTLRQYQKEARIHAALDHPNILPVKTAELIDGRFVVVYPIGKGSLADRMRRRISVEKFLVFAQQMLEAVAYAHAKRVIHCDLKPENFIVFDGDRLRLSDFGIAKVAIRTVPGSGSGTVGYMAPEQALGRASFRSDVFALGLIFWRMLSLQLPGWPFRWPLTGVAVLRRKVPEEFTAFLRRALQVDQDKRYADARQMLIAFRKLEPKLRRFIGRERRRRQPRSPLLRADWRTMRWKAFTRDYKSALGLDRKCRRCSGPISEAMHNCPWCGSAHKPNRKDSSDFPDRCPRCHRGRKLDWTSCAWCYGRGFEDAATRTYSDRRYTTRCGHDDCRQQLMPFMRYCPSCRRKVKRPWRIEGSRARCGQCGWGIVADYWSHCAWCGSDIKTETR